MIRHLLSKTAICASFLVAPFLATKLHACTGVDITFTSITFTSINSSFYEYTYQIKNNGTASVPMNTIVIQNYVSTDNTYDIGDPAASGSYINNLSTATLAPGATYTGTMSSNPGSTTTSSHPYIVINVYLSSGTDCDNTNNQYIGLIQTTTTGTRSSSLADASVNWNNDSKSFSVHNWSGNATTLEYTIVNTSGTVLFSGATTEEQNTPLHGLKEGMYIIYLSDGEKFYSKKIIY